MSAGNRPLPGISAIPGINQIPGFGGQPLGIDRPFGNVASALAGKPQYQRPASDPFTPQVQPVLQPPQSPPGAIPAGMQLVNGGLQPKPQQISQSPFGSPFGGIRRLWG
jgi:hypothetical protein